MVILYYISWWDIGGMKTKTSIFFNFIRKVSDNICEPADHNVYD